MFWLKTHLRSVSSSSEKLRWRIKPATDETIVSKVQKLVEALTQSYYFHVVMLPQKTISIRSRKGRCLRWVSNECVEINAFGVYLVLTYKRLSGSSSWSYRSVLLPLFMSLILAVYRSLWKFRKVIFICYGFGSLRMEYSFAPSHSREPLRKALKCTFNLKKDVEEVSDEVTDQPCFHFSWVWY